MLSQPLDRRTFLTDLGRGAFAIAVVSLAGCGPEVVASLAPTPSEASGTPEPTGGGSTAAPGSPATPGSPAPGGTTWARVNLGFVSAYVLVRGGEAALVDTGVSGSEGQIEATLGGVGLDWAAVGHVILTHWHNDHQGSAPAVIARAPDATVYAGEADISQLAVSPVTAVGDGDSVFDLQIISTPGHTAGSISVLDPIAGILVAGDAIRTDTGRPTLPGTQFTVDMDEAKRSIVKAGALSFRTLLVGHGEPIEGDASRLVAELGAAG